MPPPARIDRLLHLLIELDRDDIDVPARSEVSRRGIAIVQGEAEHDRQDQIREFLVMPSGPAVSCGTTPGACARRGLRELRPGHAELMAVPGQGDAWPAAPKS